MEVECPRHPGASTIGSQLLNETAPMAGKPWQPSLELMPKGRRVVFALIWYIQWKQGREGQPRNYARRQNSASTNTRDSLDNRRPLIAEAYQC